MLYKQNQKVEVVVRKDSGSEAPKGTETPSPDDSGSNGARSGGLIALLTGSTDPKRQYRVLKTNLTHAWAVGRQIANLEINYVLGGLAYKYGDEALQDGIQRSVEVLQDTTSLASSCAMGALYGSWGGPIGAVAGAVLNTAATAASLGVKYKNRAREYSVKMFKEENGIAYLRARASINMTTGRLR